MKEDKNTYVLRYNLSRSGRYFGRERHLFEKSIFFNHFTVGVRGYLKRKLPLCQSCIIY